MNVVFVGAGNLATRLSLEMHKAGIHIRQVYSHTRQSAESLASRLGCDWTVCPKEIVKDGDLYVFSLKDNVLPEILSRIAPNNALWVHTAGSVPMDMLEKYAKRCGVLYPLQTFSKTREVCFDNIPFFIEANNPDDLKFLHNIASTLSHRVQVLSSEKRKMLHLAAVFACNFTNHMYALAADLLEEQSLPFDYLLPLIDETAAKVHEMPPRQAQTGPAIRYDENVIRKHIDLLSADDRKTLYEMISKSIHQATNRR